MDKYKEYLATEVINEQKIVNYRQLSRALKVHVNTAKQMLYSFHKDRNGKRPGSVHATYQIIGRRPSLRYSTNGAAQEDEDVEMEGNPFQSSMPETQEEEEETIQVTGFVLVQEEELEAAKETFDEIETIFVYSIEPSHLQDIQLLSTCNADIRRKQRDEDPLESWKIYGGIRDPNCKRRTVRKPPVDALPAAAAPSTSAAKPKVPEPPKETVAPSKPNASKGPASKNAAPAKPKSNPFANFKKTTATPAAAKAKPAPAQDTAMAHAPPAMEFEDEGDDDDDFPVVTSKRSAADSRGAREEREAKLRAMMDAEEEEEEEIKIEQEDEKGIDVDEDMADADQEEDAKPAVSQPAADTAAVGTEQDVSIKDGRRRGRKKVLKKRTVKDEEGYLVTKEEQVWESFSEDEPEQKKAKSAFPAAKKKAPAGKPGQGNIMSFFSKK